MNNVQRGMQFLHEMRRDSGISQTHDYAGIWGWGECSAKSTHSMRARAQEGY